MRGSYIGPHYILDLDMREGDGLRRVLEDITQDDDFPLNEWEEEVVEAVLTALEPPEKSSAELISP